jgi:hypothetical protein
MLPRVALLKAQSSAAPRKGLSEPKSDSNTPIPRKTEVGRSPTKTASAKQVLLATRRPLSAVGAAKSTKPVVTASPKRAADTGQEEARILFDSIDALEHLIDDACADGPSEACILGVEDHHKECYDAQTPETASESYQDDAEQESTVSVPTTTTSPSTGDSEIPASDRNVSGKAKELSSPAMLENGKIARKLPLIHVFVAATRTTSHAKRSDSCMWVGIEVRLQECHIHDCPDFTLPCFVLVDLSNITPNQM